MPRKPQSEPVERPREVPFVEVQGRRLLRIIDVLRDRQAPEAQLEVLEKSLGLPSPEPPHDPQEAGVTHRLDEARARRRK